jgi:peptidoglycan/xylan/chitin deacetylase (PgdA/CDA1 family)
VEKRGFVLGRESWGAYQAENDEGIHMLKDTAIKAAGAIVRPARAGLGSILMLHRVIPEGERSLFPQNRALEITPGELRGMLEWVRDRGIEPIALDGVPARLSAPRDPKFICFTLDDGSCDSLRYALPVFREFDVPFAVNITNGFVGATVSVWWYFLEDALCANWRLRFRWNGTDYDFLTDTPEARLRAYDEIARLIRGLGMRRDELVLRIADAAEVDALAATRRTSMTWDEVRELAADPLVTIGAHTMGHHTLNLLTEAEMEVEVHVARRELEARIGREVMHFAYPFGGRNSVNEREFALVRKGGFKTMLTTRNANLYREHAGLTDRLPRLGVSGNYRAVEMLGSLESGLMSVMEWRFQRVVGE